MKKNWKRSVIYQVYPRSYQDSNGDGIGDLKGITRRIPYLAELGIDILWMSPIFESPNADNGYDISDYYSIMKEFGTMEDFDELLEVAHKHEIAVLLDVVLNHSSDEHEWFKQSATSKDNAFRDYYIWRDGVAGGPPNNWRSFFEGSAWQWHEETGQYYLHLYLDKQPDLNWEHPSLRQDLYKMLRFWLDKGVDGFRLDVIPFISKDQRFEDSPYEHFLDTVVNIYATGPRFSEFMEEMHNAVWSHYDCFTLGEGVGIPRSKVLQYVAENTKALDAIYHFGHFELDCGPGGKFDVVPIDYTAFKEIFFKWDAALYPSAWPVNYLGNHDLGRMTSRFGSKQYPEKSAMLLLNLILTLRGTPILYMGDELGMQNNVYTSVEDIDDVQTRNAYLTWIDDGKEPASFLMAANHASRDHARTPMPWTAENHGGFSNGKPWIPLNGSYKEVNVENQSADPASVLHFLKRAIELRRNEEALVAGDMARMDEPTATIFAYRRFIDDTDYYIVHNMSDTPGYYNLNKVKQYNVLLSNYNGVESEDNELVLNPWQSVILKSIA